MYLFILQIFLSSKYMHCLALFFSKGFFNTAKYLFRGYSRQRHIKQNAPNYLWQRRSNHMKIPKYIMSKEKHFLLRKMLQNELSTRTLHRKNSQWKKHPDVLIKKKGSECCNLIQKVILTLFLDIK